MPFIFRIHNGAYQEKCAVHWRRELDIEPHRHDELNFLATAVAYADKINTVSRGYRDELMQEPQAAGLSALYQQRAADFIGILNGCDYAIWHPATDIHLPANYDADNLGGKAQCKAAIRTQLELAPGKAPLFVAVSRLTGQKGYDYLIPALNLWLSTTEAQVVVMGTGEGRYCRALEQLQQQYPDQFRFVQGFSDGMAHQLEAAGDFFLMPSLFEPCGLNQLYSLRYGTLPVVHAVGGLRDTVFEQQGEAVDEHANGFVFEHPTPELLFAAIERALATYEHPARWKQLQLNAMSKDFSWDLSAQQYVAIYDKLA